MQMPDTTELWTIEVGLPDLGVQRIDIRDYLQFKEGYEDEMRSQPDRFAYLDAVRVELDAFIDEKEAEFKAWQGKQRGAKATALATSLGKKKATKDDLDSALCSDPAYLSQERVLIGLRKQLKKLSGWLTAMVQRERMLGHLAQMEMRGLSSYSHRGARFNSPSDMDAERDYQLRKQKWVASQDVEEQA